MAWKCDQHLEKQQQVSYHLNAMSYVQCLNLLRMIFFRSIKLNFHQLTDLVSNIFHFNEIGFNLNGLCSIY